MWTRCAWMHVEVLPIARMPKLRRIIIDSDESDHRLQLLHDNVRKFGTVFNTLAKGIRIEGTLRRNEHDT